MCFFLLGSAMLLAAPAIGQDIVRDAAGLREAISQAKPGSRILIEPGEYPGDFHFSGLHGEEKKPIVIAARDPKNPPVFRGGSVGLHFGSPSWVEIEDLTVAGSSGNGLNIDDGGAPESSARHIRLRRIRVSDIVPQGNCDGIKLSGVDDFAIEACRLERWGSGGSAIDMVGCHRGVIEECIFRHHEAPEANGVQAKGGSRDILIRKNRFEDAGGRGINLGGSTGRKFFRFIPCRNGEFTANLVAFRSDELRQAVNIGPGTSPETFKFSKNFWACADRPERSRPVLPVAEVGGVHGEDPRFRDAEKGDFRLAPESPARAMGAEAFR